MRLFTRRATAKAKGDALEDRVVRLLRREGRFNIKKNVMIKDMHGNRSEIDIVYGIGPYKTYVECKNYNRPVPLMMVAKFKSVLELNGIPLSRGLFVTTSTYTPRATTIGIETLDGAELKRREARAKKKGYYGAGMSFLAVLLAVPWLSDKEIQKQVESLIDFLLA